jgi:Xaa-Pro aminopeptidase
MNRRAGLALAALVLSIAAPARAQDIPMFTTDFPPEEFAARRARVYEAIGDTVAVVQGAAAPPGYTRFRQTNDFYYLCGAELPHAYLLLDGKRRQASLYLPHRNERREGSEGKLLSAEDAAYVKQLSGVDAVYASDLLAEHLGYYAGSGGRAVFTPLAPAEGAAMSRDLALRAVAEAGSDPWDGSGSREGRFRQRLLERFPASEIRDLTPTLDALRLIKSPREIALIKKATRLAEVAILESMRSTLPDLVEHELEAVAKFTFVRHGAQGEAYYSLIASGPNAWFPHYNAGKRRMRDGELLLMDFAPDVGYYMSDITRMWPVNGHFSPWQRELYGFYLACYRKLLAAIGPGKTAAAIVAETASGMDAVLQATTFSKPIYAAAAKRFVEEYRTSLHGYPRIGHFVGMATHDVGDGDPLRPGMVLTVEPQFRVPEEQVYIRLEDLIVVTEKGIEIVSGDLPMDVDAIEKVMAEDGLLQRYPRDTEADALAR